MSCFCFASASHIERRDVVAGVRIRHKERVELARKRQVSVYSSPMKFPLHPIRRLFVFVIRCVQIDPTRVPKNFS